MAAVKHEVSKAAVTLETNSPGSMISAAQWVATAATARDGVIQCSKDLVEIARTASHATIDGFTECSGELHDLTAIWASVIVSSLEETNRLLAGDITLETKLGDTGLEMMTQVQRLLEANRRKHPVRTAAL